MVPNFPFFTKSVSEKSPGLVAAEVTRRISWLVRATVRLVTSAATNTRAKGKDAFHRVPNSTSVFSVASCSTAWFRLKNAVETISDAVERVLTIPRLALIPLRHSPLDRAPSPRGEGWGE